MYDWEPSLCPKCQKVGDVCGKPAAPVSAKPVFKKKWVPKTTVLMNNAQISKEPGGNTQHQESEWNVPRKTTPRVSIHNVPPATVTLDNPYDFLPRDDVFVNATNKQDITVPRDWDPTLFGSI